MTNQRRYTIRCLLSTNHNIHNLLTIFNVLPHLISLLLAACEGATVTVHILNIYTEPDFIPLVGFVGARSLFVFSFKPRQLYPRCPPNSKLFGLSFLFAWLGQGRNIFCLLRTEPKMVSFMDFCAKNCHVNAHMFYLNKVVVFQK
jgi:hypothetical protein